VVAVGNAYGYEHTVTRGIVSALHRAVQVSEAQFYEDLIQTDASINPGNSGGPLLNIDGEMIGINVAVRAGAQGIGFAIPVDKAMNVAAELMASSGLKKNWHGLVVARATAEQGAGVVVTGVDKKSPAEAAGLKPGDVVSTVGEMKLDRSLDFHRALVDLAPGEQVDLGVRRGDEKLSLRLTLADTPIQVKPVTNPSWDALGLELKPIAAQDFRQQYQSRYRGGLTVTAVRPQSPASEQGIRRGDVLVGMHIWETVSLENVSYILTRPDFATLNPVKFFILRDNETLYGFLPVAATPMQAVQKMVQAELK
jgi:serine protease Do